MKTLTDLWFAAFLKLRGFKLKDFDLISRGKARFHFEISDEDYKKARIDFFKSDFSVMKQAIEELKDLTF